MRKENDHRRLEFWGDLHGGCFWDLRSTLKEELRIRTYVKERKGHSRQARWEFWREAAMCEQNNVYVCVYIYIYKFDWQKMSEQFLLTTWSVPFILAMIASYFV